MTETQPLTGEDMRKERERLGMTRVQFGEWLAMTVGNNRPYPYTRIADFENGGRDIPAKVELAILRRVIADMRKRFPE